MEIDNLILQFVATLEDVIATHQAKINMPTKNFASDRLKNYKRIFGSKDYTMLDHRDYFLSPFKKNRVKILSMKNDEWLKDNNSSVIITWLEGEEKMNPKFSIQLSTIYERALELKNKMAGVAKGMSAMGVSAEKMFGEVLLPDKILAQYYAIVVWFLARDNVGEEIAPVPEDVPKVQALVTKYRQAARMDGVVSEGKEEVTPNQGTPTPANPLAGFDLAGMLNKFTSMPAVTGLMESMAKASSGPKPDASQVFSRALEKISDPKFIKEVGSGFGFQVPDEGLQSLSSIVDAVKTATSTMGDNLNKDMATIAAANQPSVVIEDVPVPVKETKTPDLITLKEDESF